MKKYGVMLESSEVRDVKILQENNEWVDFKGSVYLGEYEGETLDEAINIAAYENSVNPEALFGLEIAEPECYAVILEKSKKVKEPVETKLVDICLLHNGQIPDSFYKDFENYVLEDNTKLISKYGIGTMTKDYFYTGTSKEFVEIVIITYDNSNKHTD